MEQQPSKVYICGPMRGKPLLNIEEFKRVQKRLVEKWPNCRVVIPHDMNLKDREYDPKFNYSDRTYLIDVMRRDMDWIGECDLLVALPGWEDSQGTKVEIAFARYLDIPIYEAYTMKRV